MDPVDRVGQQHRSAPPARVSQRHQMHQGHPRGGERKQVRARSVLGISEEAAPKSDPKQNKLGHDWLARPYPLIITNDWLCAARAIGCPDANKPNVGREVRFCGTMWDNAER